MSATADRLVKPSPFIDCDVMAEDSLLEYREVADQIGLDSGDLLIEEFRLFLAKHDLPTFSLGEVAKYMDDLTARDNPSKLGWHWCPVRAKDAVAKMVFGRRSVEDQSGLMGNRGLSGLQNSLINSNSQMAMMNAMEAARHAQDQAMLSQAMLQRPQQTLSQTRHHPASDFYDSGNSKPYTRTIPLHALKKIALIEKEFVSDKISFLVTDYTVHPHVVISPDPFLMAVIPNPAVAHGKGRFVIDVWDGPGFGIASMVK